LKTYPWLARELNQRGIGFLHIYCQTADWIHDATHSMMPALRDAFHGRNHCLRRLQDNGGLRRDSGARSRRLIAIGKPFISNRIWSSVCAAMRRSTNGTCQRSTAWRQRLHGLPDSLTKSALATRRMRETLLPQLARTISLLALLAPPRQLQRTSSLIMPTHTLRRLGGARSAAWRAGWAWTPH